MGEEQKKEERTWTEEIEVAGRELVDRVRELIEQGNVRRLIIRKPTGEVLVELPLTTGVVVGGVITIFTPVLAALGAMAALLVKVKIEVVRVEGEEEEKGEGEGEE
jgi:hypothetical protein